MAEVLVLYQISNEFPSGGAHPRHGGSNPPSCTYNAYYMSRKNGITLSTIKQSCRALQQLHPNGSDGYHWRVRIDEKPNTSHSSAGAAGSAGGGSGAGSGAAYSWWDVQDENARLPVKEATPSELKRMLVPKMVNDNNEGDVVTQEVTKAAKGAMKYMGKAMNAVAGSSAGGHHGGGHEMDDDLHAVRTPVICFKLLDLGKVRRGFGGSGDGGASRRRASSSAGRSVRRTASTVSSRPAAPPQPSQRQSSRVSAAPISTGAPRIPQQQLQQQTRQHQQQRPPVAKSTPPTADLMGFSATATSSAAASTQSRNVRHANSMPAETRAEKLKREYAQKQATSNRVWDDIDQRWVEGPVKNGETTQASTPSASSNNNNGGVDSATAAVKGITLSRTNAINKSASVQAAVNTRITDMEQSQQKAIHELRSRETQKAKDDNEEDLVRQRLEPKLKAWGEEHGQKKQLRALLANLHTILWEGSGWKQITLADVLEEKKVKRVYYRASRVVHPDKTGHLDAEKRFVAKRVFDALTQAKVEFDDGP